MASIICGVDVSSEVLDARIGAEGAYGQFANSPDGIEELAAFCAAHKVELVAMEASGGYEKRPFALLWARGIKAAIVNPRSVRQFAHSMGYLEKTDKIDAGVIAWYAAVKRLVAQEPASDRQQHLAALVTRLRQLTDLRTAQLNQRRLVSDPSSVASFDEILAVLKRQTRSFEAEIAAQIDSDPLWKKLNEEFRTIKGVAGRTVARVMAELPEIGTIPNKAVSKLTGVAPLADDSGQRTGKRKVRGGRASVRQILFVVADVVRRYDEDFKAFHRKLKDSGKPKKVIRIALAHKLLVRLNAKARDARQTLAHAT